MSDEPEWPAPPADTKWSDYQVTEVTERPSGKHAKPDLAKLGGHVEAVAEAWVEVQFAAERAVTALDGFLAGWAAAKDHYEGRGAA